MLGPEMLPGDTEPAANDLEIVIIGAGFSGLGMGIRLLGAGIRSFTILERAGEVGGTWRDNSYPGCACDIPSHLYSYSFELEPGWSRAFPSQPEIQDYLVRCCDRYGVRPHVRFDTEVAEARYDEATCRWQIRSTRGETFEADVLINGTGPLSQPQIPDLPGLDSFAGPCFHSAAWDHEVELAGKRVAVIGTGASAIQIVPELAPVVKKLHLFQRTPPWVLPKPDRSFSPGLRERFRRRPWLQRLYRTWIYWRLELAALGFLGKSQRLMRVAERMARRHIRESIQDPALRRAVTPDYPIGCKRVLISNDYYAALSRPEVELLGSGVGEIRPHAVVDARGVEHEVDAIVLATGFRATDFLAPMRIYGTGGRELGETWAEGAESFLGITVSRFPNFFMLVGPNTGLGHNSMIFMIEAQIHYILQCVQRLRAADVRAMDLRPARQSGFSRELQRKMAGTVWLSGCQSWYLGEDGRNFTLWPGFTFDYWLRTRRLRERDYELIAA